MKKVDLTFGIDGKASTLRVDGVEQTHVTAVNLEVGAGRQTIITIGQAYVFGEAGGRAEVRFVRRLVEDHRALAKLPADPLTRESIPQLAAEFGESQRHSQVFGGGEAELADGRRINYLYAIQQQAANTTEQVVAEAILIRQGGEVQSPSAAPSQRAEQRREGGDSS